MEQAIEYFYTDSMGRRVPADMVSDLDKAKDDLVNELIQQAKAMQASLAAFKYKSMEDVYALVALAFEKYGARLGGRKGNIQISSYDGRYKVVVAINESIHFGPELQAAKALIDECLREWTQGSRAELKAIINDAFNVDKQGNMNTSRVLGLTP